jgi:hypothetical protein
MSEDDGDYILQEDDENIYEDYNEFTGIVKREREEEEGIEFVENIIGKKPPMPDIDVNRPSLVVTDSVSYYNLGALCVLLYGHVTEGIKTPSIFDAENQTMVIKETIFDF